MSDDPAPVRKIRYIFTVVMSPRELPFNPLVQKTYLDDMVEKLKALSAERVGVIAVMEDGDGKPETT